jgi:imidazolonepropionase-like amidohydrolase
VLLDVYYSDPFWQAYREPDTESLDQPFPHSVLGVVSAFHEASDTIAAGNDYGISGVEPGMPLDELKLLQAAGLSPLEVIAAATKNAAYACGHGAELGTLEAGKLADLIVVDGDPLIDLAGLDALLYVVLDGEIALSP